MKAVIHQPQYFPYPGFFHKLNMADVFVIMDNTQYDKRFTNRNKIIATTGWTWITVPINKEHKFLSNNLVEINNELPWMNTHWNKIKFAYSNSKFFQLYKDYFENLFKKNWEFLFDLNFETIKKIIELLGIKIEIIKESELNVIGNSTERIINICKSIDVDTYISGSGGKNYMDENLFEKNNLKLEYQHYISPQYTQHLSEMFVPDLSIIDLIANVGPNSLKLINEARN